MQIQSIRYIIGDWVLRRKIAIMGYDSPRSFIFLARSFGTYHDDQVTAAGFLSGTGRDFLDSWSTLGSKIVCLSKEKICARDLTTLALTHTIEKIDSYWTHVQYHPIHL
jgi:hypothetical protein